MKSFLYLALLFIVLFYGILLVVVPLVMKWQFRYRAKIAPRAVHLEELPATAKEFIEKNRNSIEVWGFDVINYLNLGLAPGRDGPFMALLSNPHTREWASLSWGTSNGKSRGYIGFVTHSPDGTQVETNTNVIGSVLFATPNRHVFRFPHVHEVFTLYSLHRMLVRQVVGYRHSVLPPCGQEVTELERNLERYGSAQRSRGYMYLDGRDGWYRLTWKGAVIAGWRSISPAPLLEGWLMRGRTKALLRRRERAHQQRLALPRRESTNL
jgi:hypothetical protein